jgi:saccharopine dehydrogenase (NAD+, L-lysine-forming)
MRLWLRDEARDTERRTPLTPEGARSIVSAGASVTVERSAKRVFADDAYADAGCALVDSGGWVDAPRDALVLGVKELPQHPASLPGNYAHFAHLYKEQRGWQNELSRFQRGDGTLYDLEYLTDERGARVAAFGYWAGWLGAALGLRGWLEARHGRAFAAVQSRDAREVFLSKIRGLQGDVDTPTAIVIGAHGRSGQGACDLFEACGIDTLRWDKDETVSLDRGTLLDRDILVNCVLLRGPGLVLATQEDLVDKAARLSMISDVACDPLSDFNPLPVYDAPTTWEAPFIDVGGGSTYLTAIDNLPSLLPREASEDFAAQLLPVLKSYPDGVAWRNARDAFEAACMRS